MVSTCEAASCLTCAQLHSVVRGHRQDKAADTPAWQLSESRTWCNGTSSLPCAGRSPTLCVNKATLATGHGQPSTLTLVTGGAWTCAQPAAPAHTELSVERSPAGCLWAFCAGAALCSTGEGQTAAHRPQCWQCGARSATSDPLACMPQVVRAEHEAHTWLSWVMRPRQREGAASSSRVSLCSQAVGSTRALLATRASMLICFAHSRLQVLAHADSVSTGAST